MDEAIMIARAINTVMVLVSPLRYFDNLKSLFNI